MPEQIDVQAVVDKLTESGQHEVSPVRVTIGRKTYVGARYLERDSREPCYYLLGERPPSAWRRVVYRFPDDEGDWFIAGHIDGERAQLEEFKAFHPFGAWFQLHRWPHEEHGRLDRHDLRKPKRMKIKVEEAIHA